MVQQIIDKASQYRLLSNRSAMPAGDKQHPIAVKKVALRDLPNEIGKVMNRPGNSQLVNEKKQTPDFGKSVSPDVKVAGTGIKRQHPDGSSPSSYQVPGKVGPNTSIVYVRRKLEVDHSSARTAAPADHAKSAEAKKISCSKTKEDSKQGQSQEPKEASTSAHVPVTIASSATSSGTAPVSPPGNSFAGLAVSELETRVTPLNDSAVTVAPLANSPGTAVLSPLVKPSAGLAIPEHEPRVTTLHDSVVATDTSLGDTNRTIGQDWKDRFIQLQLFLQSCDRSNQEDYMHKLRSLSAIGRSRHAVELEKRAIHLLLEEGKELHRMKLLNVLGKGSPRDQASVPTQMTSPAQFQR